MSKLKIASIIITLTLLAGAVGYLIMKNRSGADTKTSEATSVSKENPAIIRVKVVDVKGNPIRLAEVGVIKFSATTKDYFPQKNDRQLFSVEQAPITSSQLIKVASTNKYGMAELKLANGVNFNEIVQLYASSPVAANNIDTVLSGIAPDTSKIFTNGPLIKIEKDFSSIEGFPVKPATTINTITVPAVVKAPVEGETTQPQN